MMALLIWLRSCMSAVFMGKDVRSNVLLKSGDDVLGTVVHCLQTGVATLNTDLHVVWSLCLLSIGSHDVLVICPAALVCVGAKGVEELRERQSFTNATGAEGREVVLVVTHDEVDVRLACESLGHPEFEGFDTTRNLLSEGVAKDSLGLVTGVLPSILKDQLCDISSQHHALETWDGVHSSSSEFHGLVQGLIDFSIQGF